MSREINFRAWDKEANVMMNVRDINFCGEELDTYEMEGDWIGFDCVELMQYTGLHDKNSKDGYEDDVIKTPVGKAIIKYGYLDYNICFYLEFLDKDKNDCYRKEIGYWLPKSWIIGDIHSNPELLQEVNNG